MSELSQKLTERFFRYLAISSQSNAAVTQLPSSEGQRQLAELLADELRTLGLRDVHIDNNGILTAFKSGNQPSAPKIGFVAHLDTVDVGLSPDIKPQMLRFAGQDLCLNSKQDIWLRVAEHPEIMRYQDQDIIFSEAVLKRVE